MVGSVTIGSGRRQRVGTMKENTHEGTVRCSHTDAEEFVKLREKPKCWIDENGRKYNKKRPWCGSKQLLLGSIRELGAIT